ncbi:MAG: ABC transporter ATP-binding protein [Chloroflexota bacterium]
MNLVVNGLSFHYPSHDVLNSVSFSVQKGECVAILGTNGVGKSTLLKCLNRILKQHAGDVCVNGRNVRQMDGNSVAREFGYVAQSNQFSDATVFDTVLLGRKPYIEWDVTAHDLTLSCEIIARLDLERFALRKVYELSGGEMQKVAIARALAQQPNVLLLDEPTSNLDLKNQLEVIRIIQSIVAEKQISAVVTMHDLNLALRFANRFLMMKDGRIYAAGGREVLTAENIKVVYGVNVAIEVFRGLPVVIHLD